MATINVTAEQLAQAYFNGRVAGCVRAPEGLTSEGRLVTWICISKGSHNVTLRGRVGALGQRWEQTYKHDVPIDD